MKINRRTLMSSAAVVAAYAGLSRSGLAQPARPSIVVAMPTQPDYTDPVIQNNTPTLRTLYNAYDGLLRFDYNDDLVLLPGLAESWTRLDETTFEFKLRPNVRFHDGSELTADDVVFSLSDVRKQGPAGDGATVAGQYQRTIASVEAIDPSTVRLRTDGVDPVIEKKLASWTCQIVSRRAFEKAGSWDAWLKAPVGTGPYRVVENRRDVGLILESHDEYWGGRPPFQRIEFRVVPEGASRINGLLAGDYDVITDVLSDQFRTLESTSGIEIVGGPVLNLRILAIDTTGQWLSDRRIRQAMSLAIDREMIVQQLWAGRISIPNGPQYPIFGDVYDPDFPMPIYNSELAAQLVQESGYNGEPIPYRLLNNWYPNQVLTAQVLVEQWRSIGLNVVLHQVENFSQIYQKPNGSIWDESIVASWPDPTGLVWRQYGPGGGLHRQEIWKHDEFQAIGLKFQQSSDPVERRELQHRSLEILSEEVPFIVLHSNGGFYGKKAEVAWDAYPALPMDFGPFNPVTKAAGE